MRDLARLSLHDPEYLSVHAEAEAPTPLKLQQAAMVVELHDKMDVLWSFIRAHVKDKMIVFLSTCKQVLLTTAGKCQTMQAFCTLRCAGVLFSCTGFCTQPCNHAAEHILLPWPRCALCLRHSASCGLVYHFVASTAT